MPSSQYSLILTDKDKILSYKYGCYCYSPICLLSGTSLVVLLDRSYNLQYLCVNFTFIDIKMYDILASNNSCEHSSSMEVIVSYFFTFCVHRRGICRGCTIFIRMQCGGKTKQSLEHPVHPFIS